jgi:glycerophosphoryl diester phosphodiesterase
LEKTTDGDGFVFERTAAELAQLDAGSWFDPKFAGERIPQLAPFLRWAKGKIKLFLDVKLADLQQLVDLIYETGLENDCFFWFELDSAARELKRLAPNLALKMNAATIEGIIEADEVYRAQIIEVGPDNLTDAFRAACRQRGMKVMVNYSGDDPAVIQKLVHRRPDMINTNHGDLCAKLLC